MDMDKNKETAESGGNKNNSPEIREKFIKNFLKNNKNKDDNFDRSFLDSIFDGNAEIDIALKDFLKTDKEKVLIGKSDYPGLEIDSELKELLKKRTLKEYSELQNKRSELEETFFNDYELSPEQRSNLSNEIKGLHFNKLKELTTRIAEDRSKPNTDILFTLSKYDKKRYNFIIKVLGEDIKRKEKTNLLENFDFSDISREEFLERFRSEPDTISAIEHLATKDNYSKFTTTDITAIEYLIKSSVLSFQEKKDIICEYLPQVSFYELINFNNIEKEDVNKRVLENLGIDYDDLDLEDRNSLNVEKFLFNTKDFLKTQDDLEKFLKSDFLIDKFSTNFIFEQNRLLEERVSKLDKNIDGFRKNLGKVKNEEGNNKVSGASKFSKGNYLVINRIIPITEAELDKDGKPKSSAVTETQNNYLKIIDDGSTTGIVKVQNLGVGKLNENSQNFEEFSYESFINFISNGNKNEGVLGVNSCEIIDPQQLDDRKKSKEIIFDTSTAFLDKIEHEEYVGKLEQKFLKLKRKKRNAFSSQGLRGQELEDAVNNDQEVEDLQIKLGNAEVFNFDIFVEKIKELDPDCKFKIDEGTTFSVGKGVNQSFYTIGEINKEGIGSVSIYGQTDPISFSNFLNAFESGEGKITGDAQNFDELYNQITGDSGDLEKAWSKFIFDSSKGGLVKKETNNDEDEENENTGIIYDYLIGDEKLLKIHSIDGDTVKVSTGEYKEEQFSTEEIEENRDNEFSVKSKEVSVSTNIHTIPISELYSWIKKYDLEPRATNEDDDNINNDPEAPNRHGNFASRFWDRYALSDLLAGMKVGIESIENYLKEGEEEHAAKFANATFGRILPEELRNDLLTRVEGAQKKRMDEFKEKLGGIDSPQATQMILGWLENKDSPQQKREAGAIFMMEKYGTLYAKKLGKKRGSFLWYEALGGEIGDSLYMQKKNEAAALDIPFSEENLVYVLLVLQCKSSGYKGIKRRTRLHKEFNSGKSKGQREEYEDGQNKGGDRRTVEQRIRLCFEELENGNYPNARGAFETVIGKGGPMHVMNELPFVVLFSGLAYGYSDSVLDQWKNLAGEGKGMAVTKFLANKSTIDLFSNVTLEACKIISEKPGTNYPNILVDAKKIFSNQHEVTGDEKKVRTTRDFYKKYGKVLTDVTHCLNTGDVSEDGEYADIVVTHMNDVELDNGEIRQGNPLFKRYFNHLKTGAAFIDYTNKELQTDAYMHAGASGYDIEKATMDVLSVRSGPSLNHPEIAKEMWYEITTAFHAISNRKYTNEADRKAKLEHALRGLLTGILYNGGAGDLLLKTYNKSSFLFDRLNDWGIDIEYLANTERMSIDEMRDGVTDKSKTLVSKYADQIIEYETNGKSFRNNIKGEGSGKTGIEETEEEVKYRTKVTLPEDY